MLIDEAWTNLDHKVRVVKRAYTLVKPVVRRKVLFFLRLKMSLKELFIRLIGSTELTDSVGEDLWDFQLNSEVA